MPLKGLGNAVPTEDERKRMIDALEGLRKRLNDRIGSHFGPPVYNETDDTVELKWSDERGPWGKGWVSAWINGLGNSRYMMIWRHPSYRYEADREYLDSVQRT